MKLTDVIRRPVITEKTTVMREDGRTLVFQVATDANKIDIKRAVEALFGSKVESVRTSLAHGKVKRQGRYAGRRSCHSDGCAIPPRMWFVASRLVGGGCIKPARVQIGPSCTARKVIQRRRGSLVVGI